jgi:hypothetical protein
LINKNENGRTMSASDSTTPSGGNIDGVAARIERMLESPRQLTTHGRQKEAQAALA